MNKELKTSGGKTGRTQTPKGTRIITQDRHPMCFLFRDKSIALKVNEKGVLLVNATQMGMIFGKFASRWLKNPSTTKIREELSEKGLSVPFAEQTHSVKGRGVNGTWMEWRLAEKYAEYLSEDLVAEFRQCIEMLEKQGTVKLSSNSAELSVPASLSNFPVPKTFADALRMLLQYVEENEKLQKQIAEDQHKVDYYRETIEEREWFRSSRIADDLNITTARLHQFLYEQGICRYDKKQWVAAMGYRALQTDIPYYWTNKYGKTYKFGDRKRWTPEGREFIIDLWHRENHLTNKLLSK